MFRFVLLGIFLLGIIAYFPLSHRSWLLSSQTSLDAHVPFIPLFVIPYLLLPVFVGLSLILLWSTPYRDQFLVALVIVQWSALVFWFFWPTGVVRATIPDVGFISHLVDFVYTHDGAVNAFPSSHVYLVLVSAYYLVVAFPQFFIPTTVTALAIALSTVLIKQHYLLDVFGGVIWAAAAIVCTVTVAPLVLSMLGLGFFLSVRPHGTRRSWRGLSPKPKF